MTPNLWAVFKLENRSGPSVILIWCLARPKIPFLWYQVANAWRMGWVTASSQATQVLSSTTYFWWLVGKLREQG